MRSVTKLFDRLRTKREPRVVRAQLTDEGFLTTTDSGEERYVGWSEIERIYTYKVDCFAYDTIWLAFETEGRDTLQVPEDADGFTSLMSAMNTTMPGINAEWYFDVQQPPFAENLSILFQKKSEN